MPVALETLAGADLTAFREAMARVGIPVCLGKAIGVDLNATGDTPIPMLNSEPYIITSIVFANYSDVPDNYDGAIRTAAAGGGDAISLPFNGLPFVDNAGDFATMTPDNQTQTLLVAKPYSVSNLYVTVASANVTALTVDVYVFGYYVPA